MCMTAVIINFSYLKFIVFARSGLQQRPTSYSRRKIVAVDFLVSQINCKWSFETLTEADYRLLRFDSLQIELSDISHYLPLRSQT